MLEAQRTFQHVVKHELQLLLSRGTTREDAVKLLLGRIVASLEPPEASAVRGVMRQFQMNYEDAVRALIVKQELGRLKRQGLDSFAAIEELTRKMKRREDETEREERDEKERDEEEEGEEEDGEDGRGAAQHRDVGREGEGGEEEEKEESGSCGTGAVEDEKEDSDGRQDVVRSPLLAADTVCVTVEKEGSETTSLSLCQRIGQVSISSVTSPEQESDDSLDVNGDANSEANEVAGTRDKTGFRSPSRVESSSSSTFVELAPQPRKRRAAFGEQVDTVTHSRSNSSERNVKPMFPGRKKQKLCADVGDSFLHIVTRKAKPTLSSSPKGSAVKSPSGPVPGGGKGGGGSTRSERSSKNLLKRQRASPTGMADNDESPIADEPRASHAHHRHHVLHHHSKRQKSGSPH
ncbi:unnamed protein product [Hyaloperonospora brassicae]|uniref:Uncharacterized protein n=1 Tax=Hyaloperonospora brassicae TaxID=162125 RepID=A0AAV0TCY3_HYABA|nr:unnamed protein product [Hyaloperonospora brassicae]